ncbi:MAG: T9SS type A sorting domain-containing protein [Bacteroidia bacterium]|nr:T9SS type A sorting domain-containing protein [Bacteroidia bacterium]
MELLFLFSLFGITTFAWNTPVILEPDSGITTWNVVHFAWDPVVASTFYELQLDTVPGFSSVVLFDTIINYIDATGNGDAWAYISDLYFGKTYYWRLRAYGSGAYSPWTAIRDFITRDYVALVSPAQNSQNYTKVKLDWNAHPGVFYYDYQIDTVSSFNSPVLISGFTTAFSEYDMFYDTEQEISGLFFGKTYYWRVRARNNVDASQWTTWSFSTLNQLELSSPAQNATVFTGVTIDWLAFDGIQYYQYQLDTTSNFNSPAFKTGLKAFIMFADSLTDTEAFVDNLYFGSQYFWRVRAINQVDTSSWGITRIFNTFSTVSLNLPQNNSLEYTSTVTDWLAHAGVDFYDYQLDTVNSFNSPALISGYTIYINAMDDNDDTKMTFNNLYFGKTYYWHVRARNQADTSLWSETRYFQTYGYVILLSPTYQATTYTGTTLIWQSQPGISFYSLQLDTNASFTTSAFIQVNSIDTNKYYINNLFFGKAYYWRVRAMNSTDTSVWSAPSLFYTWDQIGLLSPADGALNQPDTGVILDWLSHPGAMMYTMQMDVSNAFNSPALVEQSVQYINASPGNPDTEYHTGLLQSNTIYFWRVKIINQVDTSLWDERWFSTGSVPPNLPVAPSLVHPLLAEISVSVNATLVWTAVPGVSGYFYQIADNPDFDYPSETYTTDTFATLTGLDYHKTYYWKVRSFDGLLASLWSDTYYFTTELQQLATPILTSPADLSVDMSINATTLDWEDVSFATYYVVEYSTFDNFMFNLTTLTPVTSQVTISNLSINSIYYWRVKAVNTGMINSDWSLVWSFTTENDLNVPVLLSPADFSINIPVTNILLDWNDVALATGYQVEYATDFDFTSNLVVQTTPVSQYLISSLNYFHTYYWRVKATSDTVLASGWSTGWSFSTMIDTNSIAEFTGLKYKVFPNPTNGIIHFEIENNPDNVESIIVTDIFGQMIYETKPAGLKEILINLTGFENGVYFVKVTGTTGSFFTEVIKTY